MVEEVDEGNGDEEEESPEEAAGFHGDEEEVGERAGGEQECAV